MKLLLGKREGEETTIVQRRADGSVLETSGESTSDGVISDIRFGGEVGPVTISGGGDIAVSWKDERSETLLFDNEQQYRDYSDRVGEIRRRIFAEEMEAAPGRAGDEGPAARDVQRRLDRADERADAVAEGIRAELKIDKITTDGSAKRTDGGLSGDLAAVVGIGGRVGGNYEEGTSVTVNDRGTPETADDVRIETDAVAASGVDREGAAGFTVGPEGKGPGRRNVASGPG